MAEFNEEQFALAVALAKSSGGGGGGSSIIDDTTTASDKTWSSNKIKSEFDNLPNPMVFKGTLGSGGTITTLPTASSSNEGYTYKVITAGTYASQDADVGDVFVSNATAWVLIPAGDDVEDTWRNIKVNGTEVLSITDKGAFNLVAGTGIELTNDNGSVTIAVKSTVLRDTLDAGDTTLVFTNNAITETSLISVYADVWYEDIDVDDTTHKCTIIFPVQSSNMAVAIEVK